MLTDKQKRFIVNKFNSTVDVLKKRKSLVFLWSFIFVAVFIFALVNSFAVDTEVKMITISSNELAYSSDEGSWKIDISASFDSKIKGLVDVTYKFSSIPSFDDKDVDLVLLVDDSISMDSLKNSISTLGKNFLSQNENNTLAVIRFNSVGRVVNGFGTSYDGLEGDYSNVDGSNGLSYYEALDELYSFLLTETYNRDHTLDVMLITDGDPSKDMGREWELYKIIRTNFPHLSKFYAVQYNEKGKINETLKQISDVQYLVTSASEFSTLASNSDFLNSDVYDFFRIDSAINDDNFEIISVKKNVSWGSFYDNSPYYVDLSFRDIDSLPTGTSFVMTLKLKLNGEYIDVSGLYSILKDTTISYRLGNTREDISSADTPIVSNFHTVIYDGNAPSGCTVSNLPSTTERVVADIVKISDKVPVCKGYKFNGWDVSVATEGDSFVMPDKDVKITAKWSKVALNKMMNGTVSSKQSLYRLMASNSSGLDTNINFEEGSSGIYTRNGTENDRYPVYYYRGVVDNNNVAFAGFCWKMVRTTSTGGVKLIYNGPVSQSYDEATPITQDKYINIVDNETSPYTYDTTTNKWRSPSAAGSGGSSGDSSGIGTISFSVAEEGTYVLSLSISGSRSIRSSFYKDGESIGAFSSETTGEILALGKLSPSNVIKISFSGLRAFLYFSIDKVSEDGTMSCNNTGVSSQLGSMSNFSSDRESPADVGYMYGTKYTFDSYLTTTHVNVLEQLSLSSSDYYYSDAFSYSNGTYTLVNSTQQAWSDNYNNLVGYYTCRENGTTCSKLYYIVGATTSYQYVLSLNNGATDIQKQTMTLGKNIIDNGDGTYTLTDLVTIRKKDWYATHETYKGYYICRDLSSATCSNKNLIWLANEDTLTYDHTFNYIYGNDVSWDGEKYTLVDTFTSTATWNSDRKKIAKKYHYTCLNTSGACSNVYYIYYFDNESNFGYLTLTDGKNIEEAKEAMFTNTNDSQIKQVIDAWYLANMTDYTEKLEDTIWCNERKFYNSSLLGKDIDGGTGVPYFDVYNRILFKAIPSLVCQNEKRDGFTVSTDSGGNGALTYPVGLLTADEVMLAGGRSNFVDNYYLNTGQTYWTLSPAGFTNYYANGFVIDASGYLLNSDIKKSAGVRPVISLKKGTKASNGIGTADDPYIVE